MVGSEGAYIVLSDEEAARGSYSKRCCLKLDDIIDTTYLSRSPLVAFTILSFCSLFVNDMYLL
jgi:hypothetical protein